MKKHQPIGRATKTDARIGELLRQCRTLAGMSQEKLAEKLGVTFQQVQKYERGINRICAERLYILSRLFKVPLDFFFEGSGKSPTDSLPVDRETLEIVRAFKAIKKSELRRSALEMLRSLSKPRRKNDQ